MSKSKPKPNPKDLRTFHLHKSCCKTCPFGGKDPLPLPPDRYAYYLNNLLNNNSQHLCHSDPENQTICRGGRDIQLRWFCAMGLLNEPTDDAFNEAVEFALHASNKSIADHHS